VIDVAFNGIKIGLVLAFLIGPVFFTILQASIERGVGVGALVAVGVSLSDIVYVVICYFGFSSIMAEPGIQVYMGYGGGFILIALGFYYLLVKSRRTAQGQVGKLGDRKKFRYVIKGFLINGMSPMVPVFWIGAVSLATIDFGYTSSTQFAVFFTFVLITVLATDIAKAYLSGKLRSIITSRSLMIINFVLGIILVVFGGRLIYLARLMTLS